MPEFKDSAIESRVAALRHEGEESSIRFRADKYGLPYIDLHGVTIDAEALALLPEDAAREGNMAVFLERGKKLSVALLDPRAPKTSTALNTLKTKGYQLTLYVSSAESLQHAWERYKDVVSSTAERKGVLDVHEDTIELLQREVTSFDDVAEKIRTIQTSTSTGKVSEIIEVIFGGALALGASDVHIEPEQAAVRLRYRLDGVLADITNIDHSLSPHLLSRLKLLSGLTLNVHDEAQDGRFTFDIGERELEVRSSVIPGASGETIVMRLLDPDASSFQLEHLGLNEKLLAIMKEELLRPNGAIITTGPTGSGKTTALYAFLQEVHTPEVKIITIEDPVEYKLPGIVQTQVDDEYTFETGLRAVLRQDPDIILVGEIRDRDVAETAVHAALTGHLVFSTLHTNSAAGAFPRLIDLGVDYRMIGSAFNIIMGQRLVRILCESCKAPRDATTEEQKLIARIMGEPMKEHTVYDAPGCDACNHTKFKGRIGIYEAIRVDKAVEEAVVSDPREANILKAAESQGIPTMQQDGIMKVLAGVTSLDELERVADLHNIRTIESEETSKSNDDFSSHVV